MVSGCEDAFTLTLYAKSCDLDVREVDRDTLEPILSLLQSPDIEVQRAASAALGNLAVNSSSRAAVRELGLIYLSREQSINCTARWSVTPD